MGHGKTLLPGSCCSTHVRDMRASLPTLRGGETILEFTRSSDLSQAMSSSLWIFVALSHGHSFALPHFLCCLLAEGVCVSRRAA